MNDIFYLQYLNFNYMYLDIIQIYEYFLIKVKQLF
jgi:hypothetical protein